MTPPRSLRTPALTTSGSRSQTARRILAVTSLGLAGLLAGLLSGCSGAVAPTSATPNTFAELSGNWQFSSTAATAARLSGLGGSLEVSGSAVTGILHPLAALNQCVPTSTAIPVTGSVDAGGNVKLTGALAGGTLTLFGTPAADRKSLSDPAYAVTGGSCAFPDVQGGNALVLSAALLSPKGMPAPTVTAQQYQPVSGTYAGTLITSGGDAFPISSTLTETSQPDADGIYHVTGTASSPGNPCIPASLTATASTIDGGSISTTYTDPLSGTTITGTGTSSPDGKTLTITNWDINSSCGSDTGTGTLTLQ